MAGHTRVVWVACCHDDSKAIAKLKSTVSEIAQIAKVVLGHRRIGRESVWVAVLSNPRYIDDVRTVLEKDGHSIEAESVMGTPYPEVNQAASGA